MPYAIGIAFSLARTARSTALKACAWVMAVSVRSREDQAFLLVRNFLRRLFESSLRLLRINRLTVYNSSSPNSSSETQVSS